MSSERPYVVIAVSEDTIVVNDSIEVPNTYLLWYTLKSITVITPSLIQDGLAVIESKGNIIEFYQSEFSKKIVPGSLLLASLSSTTINLYYSLYKSGAMNRSIKKVMKEFKVDNYELPVPQASFYTKVTHKRDDFFYIPGQEQN